MNKTQAMATLREQQRHLRLARTLVFRMDAKIFRTAIERIRVWVRGSIDINLFDDTSDTICASVHAHFRNQGLCVVQVMSVVSPVKPGRIYYDDPGSEEMWTNALVAVSTMNESYAATAEREMRECSSN
jgi:hypothetical protein